MPQLSVCDYCQSVPVALRDMPSGAGVVIDLRRRADSRLQVSRVGAELFWRDGVTATRGEDIAAAAGISSRTFWRYFASKETCVQPVLETIADAFYRLLDRWPLNLSIDEYLPADTTSAVTYSSDQILAMQMIQLGTSQPALRSIWLMVCDEVEQRCVPVIARRLGLPKDSADAAQIAGALGGASRALNDELTNTYIRTGSAPRTADVRQALIKSIVQSSGNRLGAAVEANAFMARQINQENT